MAIANNREIYYRMLDYVEHKTGKKVRSWKRDNTSMSIHFLFEDGTMAAIREGMMLGGEPPELQPYELPKSFCTSCGEEWHGASTFDWQGRCKISLKSFWQKVRKVYWHRYLRVQK